MLKIKHYLCPTKYAHGLDLVAEFPIRYLSPLQEEVIMYIQ